MRIVIIAETFAKNMGYLENLLPKYFARLGAEVHVISMNLPPYYQLPDFDKTYSNFIETNNSSSNEMIDGYNLHLLPHKKVLGYMRMIGLYEKLKSLQPDIVQTSASIGWIPLDVLLCKAFLRFKLFTGNHNTASLFTEKCYAVTIDCADIAVRFFGVQKDKVEIMHLGVDTDYFFPVRSEVMVYERTRIREEISAGPSDIVCIYTGKFTEEKNALILALAIEQLRSMGEIFFGLFIGDGVQREAIKSCPSSTVLPFMPSKDLAAYYRAADIGVWPTNESTSMLDAAACGIPLVVSDGIAYRDHVDGNGLVYKMNDIDDLVSTLLSLRDSEKRSRLGTFGAVKMARDFSWSNIALRRLGDYESSFAR
jgi:glycosyltransferase involved in cell wall biosynthesis